MGFGNRFDRKVAKPNMPHLKRIINNQVFLEESEPYVYDDRRNYSAVEAAQQMLAQGGYNFPPVDYNSQGMLPSLGPQAEPTSMFSLPKNSQMMGRPVLNFGSSLNQPPTSYMTQG